MRSLMVEQTMARRKSGRVDISVKIDAEVARKAHIAAEHENMTLAEYLTVRLRPIVEADLVRHAKAVLAAAEEEAKKGRTGPKGAK